VVCPQCGVLTLDEVELTELGQTQLTEIYFNEVLGGSARPPEADPPLAEA